MAGCLPACLYVRPHFPEHHGHLRRGAVPRQGWRRVVGDDADDEEAEPASLLLIDIGVQRRDVRGTGGRGDGSRGS